MHNTRKLAFTKRNKLLKLIYLNLYLQLSMQA